MITTPNLSLQAWNLPSDPYNSEELAENWIKVDQHDHTPGKGARIDTTAIEDQAVTSAKIHPSAFPDLSIVDGSITTAKIVDANVTAAKLATNSVTTVKITDLNVTTAKIADNAVTRAKLSKAVVQGGRLTFASETSKPLTWGTSFVDTNYTVSVAYQSGSAEYQLSPTITSKTATQVVISYVYPISGTIHVMGVHD